MESGGGNHQASGKTGNAWLSGDLWELGSSWGAFNNPAVPISSSFPTAQPTHTTTSSFHHLQSSSICSVQNNGDAHHLTCLKLGKRQYYEEAHVPGNGMKRERVLAGGSASAASSSSAGAVVVVPRCQVEGCNVALVDAKDYHRRHKVCETHSKAPRVIVLGLEQRFCQQCSRFHVISEFDDSKRSCRRRLAGHNERRRKSAGESTVRNPSLDYNLTTAATLPTDNTVMGGRFPFMPSPTSPNRALSLLSSKASPWVSSDLSSRSSAALRELIAENRAALLARQLFSDHGWHNTGPGMTPAVLTCMPQQHELSLEAPTQLPNGWDNFREAGAHLTLDLMQMPSSSFEILAGRNKSKEEEEECCEIWKSLEGTHVV